MQVLLVLFKHTQKLQDLRVLNSSAISHRQEPTPQCNQNIIPDYHTVISQCTELCSITEQNVLIQNTIEVPIFLYWYQASPWQVVNYVLSEATFVLIVAFSQSILCSSRSVNKSASIFLHHGHVQVPPFSLPSASNFFCIFHINSPLLLAWRILILDSDNLRSLQLVSSG